MSPVMSKRDLKELRDFVDGVERNNHARLIAAIDAALKTKKFVRLAKVRKATKKEEVQAEWGQIREAVLPSGPDSRGDITPWAGTGEQAGREPSPMPEWWADRIRRGDCALSDCMACGACCARINSQLKWALGELSAQRGVLDARQVEELLDRSEEKKPSLSELSTPSNSITGASPESGEGT